VILYKWHKKASILHNPTNSTGTVNIQDPYASHIPTSSTIIVKSTPNTTMPNKRNL